MRCLVSIVIAATLFISCSTNSNDEITDLINQINLTAGKDKQIIVSDLFYSPEYDLEFNENEFIISDYDSSTLQLNLTPDSSFEGMTLINFQLNDDTYDIPVAVKKEKYYTFTYKPNKKYETLTLFGSFNGWNRHDIPMTDPDRDGTYETKVPLEPGVYQYKFFGDGDEIVDPNNPVKVPNGFGDFNSVRTIEADDLNKVFLHINGYTNDSVNPKYSFIAEYSQRIALTPDNVFVLMNNKKVQDENVAVNGTQIDVTLPSSKLTGKNTLRAIVSVGGQVSNTQTVILFDGKPADNDNFTWYDGIIYSIMIDRFNDGDELLNKPVQHDSLADKANYMGGDLEGIIDKVNEGYFNKLGINTIWISPVYDNPNEAFREYPPPHRYYAGYHGYWPISPDKVDEHFGTIEKVKELVSAAHKNDIKILLDFVSNHVHEQHPWFKEHRNWFGQLELPDGRLNLRFWDEFRLTTWFEPYLPSFDYEGAPEAIEAMTENALWWLKETGADGFRHDAVKHVPNKFWRALTQKLKQELDTDFYQIGETFGSYDLISSYVNNGQLSAQFNFNLYDVAIPTFVDDDKSFDGLNKEMQKTFSVYGNLHLMGNVMDSHDKNRFMSFADGDLDVSQWSAAEIGWNNPPVVDNPDNYKKLILYMAYMNTIPGLPVVYYGSEFGMTGASDPDNRRMMRFGDQLSDDEKNTLAEVQKIINLRKEHSALRYGDFYTLQADENIYAYIRSDMNERILVVLNKGDEKQKVNFEIPQIYNVTELVRLKNHSKVIVNNNNVEIEIGRRDWEMYELN